MRLIDVDLLIDRLAKEPMENRTYYRANEIAANMPTAYDADKVVEHIESSSTDKDGIVCYVDEKPVITKEVAIKIIKSGGIE